MRETSVIALTLMAFWGLTVSEAVSELEAASPLSQSEKRTTLQRYRKKSQTLPADKDSAAVKPSVDNSGSSHLMISRWQRYEKQGQQLIMKFPESPLRKIPSTGLNQKQNAESLGSLRLGNPRNAFTSKDYQCRDSLDQNRIRHEYETQQKPYFLSHKYCSPPDSRNDPHEKPLGGPPLLDPKDIN